MLNDCNNPSVLTGRHKFDFDQMFDDYIFLILKWHKAEKKEENITPQMEIHQKDNTMSYHVLLSALPPRHDRASLQRPLRSCKS